MCILDSIYIYITTCKQIYTCIYIYHATNICVHIHIYIYIYIYIIILYYIMLYYIMLYYIILKLLIYKIMKTIMIVNTTYASIYERGSTTIVQKYSYYQTNICVFSWHYIWN